MIRLWDSDHGSLLWNTFVASDVIEENNTGTIRIIESCEDTNLIYVFTPSNYVKVNIQHGTILWTRSYLPHWSNVSGMHPNCGTFKLYIAISDLDNAPFSVELDMVTDDVREFDDKNDDTESIFVDTMQSSTSGRLRVTSHNNEMTLEFRSFTDDTIQLIELSQLIKSQRNSIQTIQSHTNKLFILTLHSRHQFVCGISDDFSLTLLGSLPSHGITSSVQNANSEAIFHIATASTSDSVVLRPYSIPSVSEQLESIVPLAVSLYGENVSEAFASCHNSVCSHLWRMHDDTLVFVKSGHKQSPVVVWTREEALANVKQVHWISPMETQLEKDFAFNGIPTFLQEIQMEINRLYRFSAQIAHFFAGSGMKMERNVSTKKVSKNAHFFGFSKFVIVLTKSGKLYALQPEVQRIVWSKYIGSEYNVFVSRDHPALGLGPELVLFANNRNIVWIDGTTGTSLRQIELKANYWPLLLPKLKSSVHTGGSIGHSLALISPDTMKLTDPTDDKTFLPQKNVYFYRFDVIENAFKGYVVGVYGAKCVWSIVLPQNHSLIAFLNPTHSVIDSAVIVTGDDSLLLKYTNPHAFAFASVSNENVAIFHIVDAVTGRILYRAHHANGSKVIQIAHSENWFVYTFWNASKKMTQLVSLFLFDGAIGSHELNLWKRPFWTTTRSSHEPKLPIVLQRAFLLPTRVRTLEITRTFRGITPKFLLIGMENGQILKFSRNAVDPRQSDGPPTSQQQSEGMQQYSPMIPMFSNPTAFVTYNETIGSIYGIKASPAHLESTTLMFAWGMDLYYHRLAPSNAFDLLPMEFNHSMLVLLCIGFILATLASRHFARRKALFQAWK
ncbi:unnamed protein product [Albugo candida]|nr:unnamed protein product [Albugo candida]|eukprot:CCI49518.1 unnamed protein product [Albugo candida]